MKTFGVDDGVTWGEAVDMLNERIRNGTMPESRRDITMDYLRMYLKYILIFYLCTMFSTLRFYKMLLNHGRPGYRASTQ